MIAPVFFAIRADHSLELSFKLTREAARRLRQLGRLRITVTVSSAVAHHAGIMTTKTITVTAPPLKHRQRP